MMKSCVPILVGTMAIGACSEDALTPNPVQTCETIAKGPSAGICEPNSGEITLQAEWTKEEWTNFPQAKWSLVPPVVAQLSDDNDDGVVTQADVPDIVMASFSKSGESFQFVIRAVSGDSGQEIFSVADVSGNTIAGIAAGDIDGDGRAEIITPDQHTRVVALRADGSVLWQTAPGLVRSFLPSLADLDGDGSVEIIVGTTVLSATGNVLWSKMPRGMWNTVAADLDSDGYQEVVTGGVAYRHDGTVLWDNGELDGNIAIADLDLDGSPEIVVTTTTTVGMRLQRADGSIVWSDSSFRGGPATLADVDGDGAPEICVAVWDFFRVLEMDGSVVWEHPINNGQGWTAASAFDFNGDGIFELVHADREKLRIFAGPTGQVLATYEDHSSLQGHEYPVVADVDNDGEAEIVLNQAPSPDGPQSTHSGVAVLGSAGEPWMPARRSWNQHAYHVTNVTDDGKIPAAPQSPWTTENTFRAAAQEFPLDVSLKVDSICHTECADTVNLTLQIVNGSDTELHDKMVSVAVFAQTNSTRTKIHQEEFVVSIPRSAVGAKRTLRIPANRLEQAETLAVVVDPIESGRPRGAISECNEDNNEVVIPSPCG